MANDSNSQRYAESTNLKYGVVEDRIPEEDVYRHDENPIMVTKQSGTYWLSLGSRVGADTTITFDSLDWALGTLWFRREVGDEEITVGYLDWHINSPTDRFGLIGEWFLDQLDIDEYRTEHDCPECGDTVLKFMEFYGCENVDCDFICDGYETGTPEPDKLADGRETLSDGGSQDTAYPRDCPYCGRTLERPSQHDLHMHRNHTDDEADRAVAGAVVDEITDGDADA